jgi:hypothetical protein
MTEQMQYNRTCVEHIFVEKQECQETLNRACVIRVLKTEAKKKEATLSNQKTVDHEMSQGVSLVTPVFKQ